VNCHRFDGDGDDGDDYIPQQKNKRRVAKKKPNFSW
jgi:hypothetical protein